MEEKINVGGQAVIEGVMMRAKDSVAIAVRNEKGKIVTTKRTIKKKPKIFMIPFLRGIINLIEMLVIGMKALVWSGNQATSEEDEDFSTWELIMVFSTSMLFVIGFFVILPYFLTKIFVDKGFIFNLIDGVIRIIIFVAYILIISIMKDVKTLFENHGAEHKAVYCFEAKKPLTINNVKKYSTLHPRCGTSFIIIVLAIAILVFSIVHTDQWLINILSRIVLIPVIAGISYEILKLSARLGKNCVVKAFVAPGLWLQKITTREPTDKQIEVAIKSLKLVLQMEKIKA